jgi:DnaK suppressor protein
MAMMMSIGILDEVEADQTRFEHVRARLLSERRRLQNRFALWVNETAIAVAERPADELDRACSSVESDTFYQVGSFESDIVRQIDLALTKIERGTYGLCEVCGSKIPARRLNALPFVSRCVACQEENERRRSVLSRKGVASDNAVNSLITGRAGNTETRRRHIEKRTQEMSGHLT